MTLHYRNIGYSTLPFENTGINYIVLIGASSLGSTGTITANAITTLLEVEDAQEQSIDTVGVNGINYVAAPTTAGNIILVYLPKKLLIPPGGAVNSPDAVYSSAQFIECLDTSSIDGRDSLENALELMK